MNRKHLLRQRKLMPRSKGVLVACMWVALTPFAAAGTPDWFKEAVHTPLQSYSEETNAVVLLSEQVTTVKDSGEITTTYRRVVKILRREGSKEASIIVFSDNDTRIGSLKGWGISAKGDEFEVKEKDAVETGVSEGVLYADTRKKVLTIPTAEPGAIVGYEYQQKRRPFVFEDHWRFQEDVPVVLSRFVLRLPSSWTFKAYWLNHDAVEPQAMGQGQWSWQMQNLPGIDKQPLMPPFESVAGALTVHYQGSQAGARYGASWQEIATWYRDLTNGRRQPTAQIQQQVKQLTAGLSNPIQVIQTLANFVQHEVRYVEIEIGIGGFQPHFSQDVFSNRYGDCKDKATLLTAMLQAAGIDSYYVLINTARDVIRPDIPSLYFDHAIVAIRLPKDAADNGLYATVAETGMGRILFFDPTDETTPFGFLPASLQANYGLIVTETSGLLIQLPLLDPPLNRLLRSAQFTLSPDGTISGVVQEIRQGYPAEIRRAELLRMAEPARRRFFEHILASSLGGSSLVDYSIEGLDNYNGNLVLHYRFFARDYAKLMGGLLLVRPRVLGQKGSDVMEKKQRKYPVEFKATTLETDLYDIKLPPGYSVDELPSPIHASYDFGEYRSQFKVEEGILHYQRDYKIAHIDIPSPQFAQLKDFFRNIAEDETNTVVLKKAD